MRLSLALVRVWYHKVAEGGRDLVIVGRAREVLCIHSTEHNTEYGVIVGHSYCFRDEMARVAIEFQPRTLRGLVFL